MDLRSLNSLSKGSIGVFLFWAISLGYPGIAFFMILESCALPVPSEIILTVSGFLSGEGKLNFYLVVLSATIGTFIGSSILFFIGKKGGRPFVAKYGKYFLVNKKEMNGVEAWFEKYGGLAVFIGMCLPVIKTYIGFPPGASLMKYKKFAAYSILGSALYNAAVAFIGLEAGRNISLVSEYFHKFQIAIVLIAAIFLAVYFYKHIKVLFAK